MGVNYCLVGVLTFKDTRFNRRWLKAATKMLNECSCDQQTDWYANQDGDLELSIELVDASSNADDLVNRVAERAMCSSEFWYRCDDGEDYEIFGPTALSRAQAEVDRAERKVREAVEHHARCWHQLQCIEDTDSALGAK